MRVLATVLTCLLMASGCSSVATVEKDSPKGNEHTQRVQVCPSDNRILPGLSNREDVFSALGKPFIDMQDNQGRLQWVYMETLKTQIVYTFDGEQVVSIHRSREYGHPVFTGSS